MAGGGLDDELLALAGGSAPQIHLSSDKDDRLHDRLRSSVSLKRAPSSKSSLSLAKKRRMDLLDESASASDADAPASADNRVADHGDDHDDNHAAGSSDAEVKNPYPYQGIYKSPSDMEQLMSMTELQREDILARRTDELNRTRQKYQLAALVKAQKAAAGATKRAAKKQQSNKNKNNKTTSTTKTTKRAVRGAKRRAGGDSDDASDLSPDDSDSDSDSDSDQEDEDEDEDEDDGGDSDFDYGGGAASAAKSRKKKLPGQTDAKSAKLSELRKKRSEKAAGISPKTVDSDHEAKSRSRRGYASHSSDDDVGYSDFSDQHLYRTSAGRSNSRKHSSRRPRRYSDDEAAPSATAEPSLADLNAARISRDRIESRLYAPRWKEALTGAFIRFSWGKRPRADGRGEEQVYRIHQITDVVQRPGKFYDLSDHRSARWCNVYLVFQHHGSEHEAKLNMLSRHEFTQSERERWLAFLKGAKQRVPKANAVANKAVQLERFFTTALTEQDIAKVLQHKKRLRQEAISVMGPSAVVGATVGFGSNPVDSPATSTPTQTHTPGTPGTPGTPNPGSVKAQSLEQRLAAVNQRNRAIDRTRSSQLERKARASKLAAIAKQQQEAMDFNKSSNAENNHDHQAVQLASAKPAIGGMGNRFVALKNFATTLDVDLGDF